MSRVSCALILACATVAPAVIHAQTSAPAPDTSARAVIAKAVSYLKDYKEALQFV